MPIGFGRVRVNGVVLDDPYDERILEAPHFEVISDHGPIYEVKRLNAGRWAVLRIEPLPSRLVGSVVRGGWKYNREYAYKRSGRIFSDGHQNAFINAVFGVVGKVEK